MILGLPPLVFIHTLISLAGIATGFAVLFEMWGNRRSDRWTAWFLATTILTSATGFLLPAAKFMPSHGLAVISLATLAVTCYARYAKRMVGAWRLGYVLTAVAALYFNVFALVVQLFLKVPALHELVPQQNEPPFAIAQAVVLVAFVAAGIRAARRFHGTSVDHEETARA